MTARVEVDFLGRGWAFPVAAGGGRVELAAGDEDIRQAVLLVLGTRVGERVMRPEFGSRLAELVFAPNNESTRALAAFHVKDALERWEPRIEVAAVDARPAAADPARLEIGVSYVVRASNTRANLVYPFYLEGQGTGGAR